MERISLPWLDNRYCQLIILLDGAADEPHEFLGGKTPFEVASMPYLKRLIHQGFVGEYQTIPAGCIPSSEVANLMILGYDDEARNVEGRAGFEALGLGLHFSSSTLCYRCDLHHYPSNLCIPKEIGILYRGVGHRHIFRPNLERQTEEQAIAGLQKFIQLTTLESPHIWGRSIVQGIRFEPFQQRYHFRHPYMISAVPVMWGIAKALSIPIEFVPGATGETDSNFRGKALQAMKLIEEGSDFVYLHIEAPDEASHRKNPLEVKEILERIDYEVIMPITEWRTRIPDCKPALTILPDHYTSSTTGRHLDKAVPYLHIKS